MQDWEFDMLEFFAGNANLSRCMKYAGYKTGRLDILYPGSRKRERSYKSNPMDMTSVSGFWLLGLHSAFPRFVEPINLLTAVYRVEL